LAAQSIPTLDRARADIRSGRLWKARDRLTAAVKHDPRNQQLLDLLGEVYYGMGDLPAAGRFWILTDRADPNVDVAISALEERWGGNLGEKLKMIPFKESLEAYPPMAQKRIRPLLDQARAAGIEWPRQSEACPGEADFDDSGSPIRDGLIFAFLAVLGPGLWLFGVAAAIYLLINWIF
jgi:hypothetical protein